MLDIFQFRYYPIIDHVHKSISTTIDVHKHVGCWQCCRAKDLESLRITVDQANSGYKRKRTEMCDHVHCVRSNLFWGLRRDSAFILFQVLSHLHPSSASLVGVAMISESDSENLPLQMLLRLYFMKTLGALHKVALETAIKEGKPSGSPSQSRARVFNWTGF